MNAKVGNLVSELVPTAGVLMQNVTVGATPVVIGPLDPKTTGVFVSVDGGAVLVTFDGTVPEAANGHLFPEGASDVWSRDLARNARLLRAGATDGKLRLTEMTR
jgi:DNA-binding beta-propeller fold protein YncE